MPWAKRTLLPGYSASPHNRESSYGCSYAPTRAVVKLRNRTLTTISFLFSAPGWEPSLGGFPALSSSVGQFLIKDVVLLGAAIWTCGEAYTATNYGH
jgi:Protein of unknown function, DUF417